MLRSLARARAPVAVVAPGMRGGDYLTRFEGEIERIIDVNLTMPRVTEAKNTPPNLRRAEPRRVWLKRLFGLLLGLPVVAAARGRDGKRADVRSLPPQENDLLVFAYGEREQEVIAPEDLPLGARQVFAYAMDPETRQVRNESRLNQVILVHIDPESLSEETCARAVDGIVAYSAICTHTGCDVTDWAKTNHFKCPCHFSEFDPSDGARVLNGPAPRPLAALPLKLEGGVLMAAGGFIGRVGFG